MENILTDKKNNYSHSLVSIRSRMIREKERFERSNNWDAAGVLQSLIHELGDMIPSVPLTSLMRSEQEAATWYQASYDGVHYVILSVGDFPEDPVVLVDSDGSTVEVPVADKHRVIVHTHMPPMFFPE